MIQKSNFIFDDDKYILNGERFLYRVKLSVEVNQNENVGFGCKCLVLVIMVLIVTYKLVAHNFYCMYFITVLRLAKRGKIWERTFPEVLKNYQITYRKCSVKYMYRVLYNQKIKFVQQNYK